MESQAAGNFADRALNDRYQVQRQLGKRAGRRTFLAQDLQTQTQVVVKLLLFNVDFEWDDLKLFEREAETLQSLSHPSIPRYLDHFELDLSEGKGFALVQTYIEARSLEDHLKAGRSFSEAEMQELAIALLEILTYLHNRQPPVIHRDIKPSNILLTNRSGNSVGQVYLVDFGSVQTLAAREGGTITVVGTYGYMPPEQFGGRAVPASDLYSLGATLIYLVTGQHPADLPQADLRIQFESSVRLHPKLTRWLRQLIEPSLDRRFSSAQEALQALKGRSLLSTIDSPSILGPPTGTKVRLRKTADELDILIPPPGFSGEIVGTALFAIAWNSFILFWTWGALDGSIFFALFSLPFWGVGIGMLLQVLAALFVRTHLKINQQHMTLHYEMPGIEYSPRRPARRQDIRKLIHSARFYKTSWHRGSHRQIEVKPRIILWAGTRKYELGSHLTEPELDWLTQELSEWLDLPISTEGSA